MDFEKVIKKHNFRTEIPRHMRRSAGYLAPEEVEGFVLGILISQNPDIFAKLLDDIKRKTRDELMVSLSEKLDLSPPSSPDIYLLKQGVESGYTFVYTEHESWVGLSHKAILESVESTTNHPLIHELAHYLMYVFNKEAMMDDIRGESENRNGIGRLSKGLFLERNRFQVEGFAEWLGGNSEYQGDHQQLAEAAQVVSRQGPWSLMKFLRRQFDEPYSLGLIIYNLVEQVDGLEGVKDLAFARSVDRAGMLARYRNACVHLGLDLLDPPPRRKRLIQTYEDMVSCRGTGRDDRLEGFLRDTDKIIEGIEKQGEEPKILYYNEGGPLLDIVTESFWHHGVFLSHRQDFPIDTRKSMNLFSGTSKNVFYEINKGDWNLFIASGGTSFEEGIENSCARKNITYIRTP